MNKKIAKFEEKIYQMEEQKLPQLKEKEVIDAVKLSNLICSDILPVVATLNKNGYEDDRVAIEPQVCTFEPNHIIEVAAWEYTI